MYQRRISRDKVHTIFKNSKLNVMVYTRYTPGVYAEGCIVFVFPFLSLSLSLSLSLLADADPESCFFLNSNAVLVDEGREDPNTTKAGHHRPTSETPIKYWVSSLVNFWGIAL